MVGLRGNRSIWQRLCQICQGGAGQRKDTEAVIPIADATEDEDQQTN